MSGRELRHEIPNTLPSTRSQGKCRLEGSRTDSMKKGGSSLLTLLAHNSTWGSQDKERKHILQLPFWQMAVLPNHHINDYAWKPEREICG